jgi:hypothetical protein
MLELNEVQVTEGETGRACGTHEKGVHEGFWCRKT